MSSREMTCQEAEERFVDFLYREIGETAPGPFEVHLAGCDSCRAKLGGLERTLGVARQALRGPLDQVPPARVRAGVLKAAAQVASARRAGVPADFRPGGRPGGGIWEWLRRPWILPAFAAAGAIALFVIVRSAMPDPSRMLAPPPVASPERSPQPARLGNQVPPSASPPAMDEAVPASRHTVDRVRGKSVDKSGDEPSRFASPPAPVSRASKRISDDALGDLNLDGAGGPKGGRQGGVVGGLQTAAGDEDTASSLAARKSSEEAARAPRRSFAERPPRTGLAVATEPAKSPVGAAEAEAPGAVEKKKESARADEKDVVADAERMRERAPALSKPASALAAPAPAEEVGPPAVKADGTAAVLDLVRRAEWLFGRGRWQEALPLYREMLRRFPEHARSLQWRQRITECEKAVRR